MTLYYSIIIILALSSLFELSKSYKLKNSVLWFWVIFFTLFGGLRWETGNDWDQYFDHFLFSDWTNIFNYDRYGNGLDTLEFGFVFINVLIKTIFGQFYWYNIITTFFIMFTQKYVLQKLSPFPILGFVLLNIMTMHYFGVRQSLSVVFIFWAYIALKNKKNIKFLILVLVTFTIHQAAIVFLPIILIQKITFNWFRMTILYISTILFSYYFRDFIINIGLFFSFGNIQDKLMHYTEFQTLETKASISGWIINYFFLSLYLFVKKIGSLKNDLWFNTLFNITVIYSMLFILFVGEMNELVRLNGYFFLSQIILLTSSLYYLLKYKALFGYLYAIFLSLYIIYKIYSYGQGYYFEDSCLPYKSILS